jgi:hypothetical protein
MNSGLQCIAATRELTTYFFQESPYYKSDLDFGKTWSLTGGKIAETYTQVIKEMYRIDRHPDEALKIGKSNSCMDGVSNKYNLKEELSKIKGG